MSLAEENTDESSYMPTHCMCGRPYPENGWPCPKCWPDKQPKEEQLQFLLDL